MRQPHQDQVGQVGGAAAGPPGDVMGLQVAGVSAAGEAAAFAVDGAKELPQPQVNFALGAALVELGQGQGFGDRGWQQFAVVQPRPAGERVEVGDQPWLGSAAHRLALVIQPVLSELQQRLLPGHPWPRRRARLSG